MWGTCLGFQTISDIVAGGVDVLSDFDSTEMELPLQFSEYANESSRMFSDAPSDIVALFTDHSFTTNWHHYGISPETFETVLAPGGLKLISSNVDINDKPFVSTMEHMSAPIYAVQWHVEANAYDREHDIVDHSEDAVRAMQYLGRFFVSEARAKGLGPGDIGTNECRFTADIDTYPLVVVGNGAHSLKFEFK